MQDSDLIGAVWESDAEHHDVLREKLVGVLPTPASGDVEPGAKP